MSPRYTEALAEVDYILNALDREDFIKIPEKFRKVVVNSKSKFYEVNIDLDKPLEDQELKEETKAILAVIYRKYLAPKEERERLENEFLEKLKAERQSKRENQEPLSYEIKFENKVISEEIEESKEIVSLIIPEKEVWYVTILKKVKGFFNK